MNGFIVLVEAYLDRIMNGFIVSLEAYRDAVRMSFQWKHTWIGS